MIGHTQLPWHAEDDRVVFGSGLLVAECYGGTTKESKANAAFIAKAGNNHEAMDQLLAEAADFLNNSPCMDAMDLGNKIAQFRRHMQADVGGARE